MPVPKKTLGAMVALGIQYGPQVLEAAKKAGITPESLVKKQVQTSDARKNALEHAHHLIDGSVLTVFEGDKKLYVVFTGDKPVGTHPQTRTPLATLVEGYDLDKRVRPTELRQHGFAPAKPSLRRRPGAPGTPPTDAEPQA